MVKKQVIRKSALAPTVLISGGAGFIGSHLAESLLSNGARVIVLDNYNTGKDIHINSLLENGNFAFYNIDINQGLPGEIESVDYIFHLAGLEEYLFSKEYLNLDSLMTNSLGTKNLLDLAKSSEAKFLLTSTIDVYQGKMSQLDLSNYFGNTNFDENKFSLTEAKRFAEAVAWEYFKKYDIDIRIARLPEIYGPRMDLDASGSLGAFLKDVLNNRDITVYGDGVGKEYYLYISDAVSGLLKSLFSPNTKGNIYTLVPESGVTVLETAYLVKKLADGNLNIQFKPGLSQSLFELKSLDTYNLKNLDWKSKVDMREGIIKTLQSFGFSPNENNFKPAKFIQKQEPTETTKPIDTTKTVNKTEAEAVSSIIDLSVERKKSNIDNTGKSEKTTSPAPAQTMPLQVPLRNNVRSFEDANKTYLETTKRPIPDTTTKQPDQTSLKPMGSAQFSNTEISRNPVPQYNQNSFQSNIDNSLKNDAFNSFLDYKSASSMAYPLEKKTSIFTKLKSLFTIKPKTKIPNITKKINFSPKLMYAMNFFAIVLSALIVFIAIPLGGSYFYAKKGIDSLERLNTSVVKLTPEEIATESTNAFNNFVKAKSSFDKLGWLFKITKNSDTYDSYNRGLVSLINFTRAGYSIASAIKPLSNLWEVIRPDTTTTLNEETIETAKFEINKAQKFLKIAGADYVYINKNKFPISMRSNLDKYGNILSEGGNYLGLLSDLMSGLPQILGVDKEKTYIIWFQNSNEIRPTGGFIGSYGILKFDKGKLKNLEIDDIYNPDGQIDVRNIKTTPPKPISDLLKEDRLYLRNSNWNPDFTKSALAFDDLYFKINGTKVDGFISVDLSLAQNLLKVTGPVFLAAYNEEINADNLYERAQFHSDFNYKDGSSQKRSFLTILGQKLMEKLFTLPQDKIPLLANEINKSLEQRHLIIYLNDNPFNAVLKEKGWDGSLRQTTGDYLNIVNANLGGTKANYYVKNNFNYNISSMTRDGLLRATLVMEYTHTGKDNAWPGGPYTDYVRILTQGGTKLTGATIKDDNQQEQDIFNKIVVSKESTYNVFETNFKLEPGHKVTLTVKYDLPTSLSITGENKSYSLLWQKQPGTNDDNYSFGIKPPFGMTVVDTSSSLKNENGEYKNSGFLNSDVNYFINLR